ncbi:integrin alpha-X-like [Rhynchocyon petersi]
MGSTEVVVGAPLEVKAADQTGSLYRCAYGRSRCEPLSLQAEVTRIPSVSPRVTIDICPLSSPRHCEHIPGPIPGSCHQPRKAAECPSQEKDIVFLIDGSGSISRRDFDTMINFMRTVMSKFQRPQTQFSLMQFSGNFQTHFTFNEFRRHSDPRQLLDGVRKLGGLTYTATAIKKAIDMFYTINGARKDATKILIVITDGVKQGDSLDYKDVTPTADAAGITRYAIGVGKAFIKDDSVKELNAIASKPTKEHVFRVDNFNALKSIENQLKEKIFAIEGTKSTSTSSFEFEMSQEGFSAIFTPDGPVLGAVGSFTWSGGAFLHPPNSKPTFINTSQENVDMRDSYLGYATESALWKGVQSLILGAPRHQHTGKVLLFTQMMKQWRLQAEVTGTQIGSYFGASLCSVDVDRDDNTDLVLVGAPNHYQQTRGGQVSICPLPQRTMWQCQAVLHGDQGHPWSRFGAAMTVLGDVNGDDLTDVVIGAPGEQENQGAIYLFHGASGLGINPSHSQRITGSQFFPKLQYFGQSLSGGHDLTKDGLVDLAVGAQGRALLLRTRPLLRVWGSIIFRPTEIARSVFECQEQVTTAQTLGDAIVCLHISPSFKNPLDDLWSSVTYDLTLDPGRLIARAIFDETETWNLTKVQALGLGRHCETVKLLLLDCVEDTVTPITLRLNFSLVGKPIPSLGNLQPMLAMDSERYFTASLPFEKNCGTDHICQDDLSITFDFSGLNTLVVGSNLELDVQVTVRNDGEDSYGTTITFSYPAGLSFRRVKRVKLQGRLSSPRLTCDSTLAKSQGSWNTHCSIKNLIFRDNAQINFMVIFDILPKAVLGDQLLLMANVSSENNTPRTEKTTFQKTLPVKYAVYTTISSHDQSTKYLNFSTSEEEESSVISHKYQVNNLGQRDLPVSINFWVPVELNKKPVWTGVKIIHAQTRSIQCSSTEIVPTEPDFLTSIQKNPVLNCSTAVCLRLRCDIPSFGVLEELNFIVNGKLNFGWVSQTLQKKVLVTSVAQISFYQSVYSQLPGQESFMKAQTETVLERYKVHNPIPLIVGSSVGGLLLLAVITAALYKAGFFKRQYKEMMEEANRMTAPASGTPDPTDAQ